MHEGLCEQYVKSLGLMAPGFDFFFARTLVHCDNKPQQIGLNHNYNMTFSILTRECEC